MTVVGLSDQENSKNQHVVFHKKVILERIITSPSVNLLRIMNANSLLVASGCH